MPRSFYHQVCLSCDCPPRQSIMSSLAFRISRSFIRLAISPYLRVVSSVCLPETTNAIPSRSLTSLPHTHTATPDADRSNDISSVSPAVGAGVHREEAHAHSGPGKNDLTTPTVLLTTGREKGESSDDAERGRLMSVGGIRLIPFNASSPGAEVMICVL